MMDLKRRNTLDTTLDFVLRSSQTIHALELLGIKTSVSFQDELANNHLGERTDLLYYLREPPPLPVGMTLPWLLTFIITS